MTVDSITEFLHLLLAPLRAAVTFRKASVNGKKTWLPQDVTLWFAAGARNTSWQRKSGYFWTHNNSTPTERIPNLRTLSHQHNLGICNQNVNTGTKQEAFSLSLRRAPTFKVSLWALSPCRILCPPPMRSSMPWWMFWREELNCSDSSIDMVVSASCERNAGTWLTLLAGQLLRSHHVWLLCLPFDQGHARRTARGNGARTGGT